MYQKFIANGESTLRLMVCSIATVPVISSDMYIVVVIPQNKYGMQLRSSIITRIPYK